MERQEDMFRSHLPQPSKLISPGKHLSELSEFQSNSRLKPLSSASKASLKHKLLSYGEPEPKRKTFLEKRTDPRSSASVSAANLQLSSTKGVLNNSKISHVRGQSTSNFSRSVSSTRKISNGRFSCSVGQGSRPEMVNTRSTFSQSTMTRPITGVSRSRTLTPLENCEYDTNTSRSTMQLEWDVQDRLQNMEAQFSEMKETIKDVSVDKKSLEENMAVVKARNIELESLQCQLTLSNQALKSELDSVRQRAETSHQSLLDVTKSLNDLIRAHQLEVEELRRDNRVEVEKLRRYNSEEMDRISRLNREKIREIEQWAFSENEQKIRELEQKNRDTLENEKLKRAVEVEELKKKLNSESSNLSSSLQEKDNEIHQLRNELIKIRHDFDSERELRANAQKELSLLRDTLQKINLENSTTVSSLEHTLASLRARILFLESGSKAQSDSFAEMEARLEEAVESAKESKKKLIKEESLRRSLFNQVQELKGNIRVMCRIRPVLNNAEGALVKLKFPDVDKESKELELIGKEERSSFGTITRKTHSFSFDRVFGPNTQNQEVFEEISQLVQSALDGYNVCIFCYGQTGSGKTHTMSSPDGMIPRATQQIYQTASDLRDKGWVYSIEGNFVEVYNEEIHDLLGNPKDTEKKKHEIRHDDQKKQTKVTGLNTVTLDSPNTVETILKQAAANRSVAATKSNERSSRSHSVFMLKLVGYNKTTNETSEGTLNLVDLAGSERLKQSGAEGERMKETQNINKSLSCLGDVIGALGQGKEGTHIPYRNSKLTYLLQYSLGGNSKTLMFVMASPLEANLTETLTSLKFATKVHNTHIGTAKRIRKAINDSSSFMRQ